MNTSAAHAWNREYQQGRYQGEPPVGFINDIITAARAAGHTKGLYIGCGTGRNYVPLIASGLDLVGLDISQTAIERLAQHIPARSQHLVHGDLSALPPSMTYPLVIGIQVFQHGTRAQAHAHIAAAAERLAPGGVLCIRVNAEGTDLYPACSITERSADGGLTVCYLEGAKEGLDIHFFGCLELHRLLHEDLGLTPALWPRVQGTWREPEELGQWLQWECIYTKPHPPITG